MIKQYTLRRIATNEIALVAKVSTISEVFEAPDYVIRSGIKDGNLWGIWTIKEATEKDIAEYQSKKKPEKEEKKEEKKPNNKKKEHVAVRTSSGVRFK